MRGWPLLRTLAFTMAGLFLVSTLLQLADQLNLLYKPPAIPELANLVDRVMALIPYRHDVWPLFFAANLLAGLGFLVLVALGLVLAARVARSDDRRYLLLWALVMAGAIGAIAQTMLIGAVKASIDIPYCDCGFKEQEIVSQVWAEMVIQSAAAVLIDVAALLAAAGLVIAGILFGGSLLPAGWQLLSFGAAALLVVSVILGWADVAGELNGWLTAAITGLAIPAWALWIGLRFPGAGAARPDPGGA